MEIQFAKWGNSLGLRIPKILADEVMVNEGSIADILIRKGEIVIRPKKKRYSFDELMDKVNSSNIPDTIEEGKPVGKEIVEW